ncbi:uncharacterized protein BX663DRAFT_559542 [Cokeromyces recurvatus]|uniref:uncharacterized protein n=1 Tax=Cokeromyces recurvatus TaxID=90255 RepID=UPI00221EFF70|nr:uncharacterized protein BX663DRAFT_559542 [Cokeromyces recurvatus]KAI7904521.1 hypothetical protein BX663DRAFT_559542 [Cokeromyces recurvatus]
MFKANKKKKQLKGITKEKEMSIESDNKITLLDDVSLLTQDFRSSVIIPQLNKNMLNDKTTETAIDKNITKSNSVQCDGSKQYQDLATWRHQRSQYRYSNGLFGGKQRNRPKMTVVATTKVKEESEVINKSHKNSEDSPIPLLDAEFYQPESNTEEENFFFEDFSSLNHKKEPIKKKSSHSNKNTKAMKQFNLSSFAQDLHDNRLSVIQPRQSKIMMTEDDELELEKLLNQQRQRISMMTINNNNSSSNLTLHEIPPLDLIHSYQEILKNPPSLDNTFNRQQQQQQQQQQSLTINKSRYSSSSSSESSSERYSTEVFITEEDSNKIAIEDDFNVSQDSTKMTMNYKPITIIKPANSFISKKEIHHQDHLKRSLSTASQHTYNNSIHQEKVKKSTSMRHIKLQEKPSSLHRNHVPERMMIEKTLDTEIKKKVDSSMEKPIAKPRGLLGSLRQVSRSSKGHQSFKGLVRSFSTAKSSSSVDTDNSSNGMSRAAMAVIQHSMAEKEQKNNKSTFVIQDDNDDNDKIKSRHNSSQHPVNNLLASTPGITTTRLLISQFLARASSTKRKRNQHGAKMINMLQEDDAKGGGRRRRRSCCRRYSNKVVRRTIIYVEPGHTIQELLDKKGVPNTSSADETHHHPLLSSSTNDRQTVVSNSSTLSSTDDEIVRQSNEYIMATKISRQTSVRKKVVKGRGGRGEEEEEEKEKKEENNDNGNDEKEHSIATETPHPNSTARGKNWKLENMDNHDQHLEGLELREMSDGSVVWGIVKKQGNRKSFYVPNQKNEYEHLDDEIEDGYPHINLIEENLTVDRSSSTPPPIPKRSPHRRRRSPSTAVEYQDSSFLTKNQDNSTMTDIYYSNQVTLPNLLKMIQGHEQSYSDEDDYKFNEKIISSVDDQLDEMMRILTSQQC